MNLNLPIFWIYPELYDCLDHNAKFYDLIKSLKISPGYVINSKNRIQIEISELQDIKYNNSNFILPIDGNNPEPYLEYAIKFLEKNKINCILIPVFITYFGSKKAIPETKLPNSFFGLFPGDYYPPKTRVLLRRIVRMLFPDRFYLFLCLENLALAGIDIYNEAKFQRFFRYLKKEEKTIEKPIIIAISGIDGSGKSSHLKALKEHLENQGLKVKAHKIYRHGVFHDTVTDLTRQCKGDKNLHLWRVQRIAKAFDSVKYYASTIKPDMYEYDILIFDRYVHTHFAAGANRFHSDPFTRELLWLYPKPHKFFLMDIPAKDALERIGERSEKTVDENLYMLSRFREGLLNLAKANGYTILDARDPFEKNQKIIRKEVEDFLKSKGLI